MSAIFLFVLSGAFFLSVSSQLLFWFAHADILTQPRAVGHLPGRARLAGVWPFVIVCVYADFVVGAIGKEALRDRQRS